MPISKIQQETNASIKTLEEHGVPLNKLVAIDDDLYHSLPGYSSTFIKNMYEKCPAYAKFKRDEDKEEPSEALIIGRAIHTFLLQPEKFQKEFQIAPNDDKRRKEYKEWLSNHSDPDKLILRNSFREMAKGVLIQLTKGINIFDNVISHPEAIIEKAVFTVHKKTGVLIKMKADVILNSMGFDLKSTIDAAPDKFAGTIGKYNYDIQAAFYILVCQTAGVSMKGFSFISVEKDPPFLSSATTLAAEDILQANDIVNVMLKRIATCVNTGNWEGYMKSDELAKVIRTKPWRKRELEDYMFIENLKTNKGAAQNGTNNPRSKTEIGHN